MTVTANILDVLGVSPMLGRGFANGEDQDGAAAHDDPVARGVAAAVRRQHQRDRQPASRSTASRSTIIGVMPRWFEIFGLPADALHAVPSVGQSRGRFQGRSLIGIGRLKAGVTRDQAQAEMEGVFAQVRSEQPDFNTGWTINLVPLREQLVGDVRLAGAGAVRRGRRGAADRVRQHRQPDADARVGAAPRAGDSIGARRRHGPASHAA